MGIYLAFALAWRIGDTYLDLYFLALVEERIEYGAIFDQ
jgi:hypothetical protein